MEDQPPLDVAHDDNSVDTAEIDRRPPWVLAAAGLLIVLVLVVSIATRNSGSSDEGDSPEAAAQPTQTQPPAIRIEEPEPVDGTSPEFDAGEPTRGNPTENPDSDLLPPSPEVLASLPPGGIDGWMFSLDGLSRLTRTDLTTGEELRVTLRDEDRSGLAFILSRSRLVQVGDKVIWASSDHLYLVDIKTLEVIAVEFPSGPAAMIANDDATIWLRTFNDLTPSDAVFNVDLAALEVSELFTIDPVNSGFIIAGASKGILRYYAPFGGSWELDGEVHTRVEAAIVAGTNGGTLEIRCDAGPTDCVTTIHNIDTGEDVQIDAAIQTFGTLLSPALDAVAVFGTVVYTDGTVIDLPRIGEWTWSSNGRFIASDDLVVVDLAGEHAPFQVPAAGRSTPRQEALVVLRPTG